VTSGFLHIFDQDFSADRRKFKILGRNPIEHNENNTQTEQRDIFHIVFSIFVLVLFHFYTFTWCFLLLKNISILLSLILFTKERRKKGFRYNTLENKTKNIKRK